MAEPVFLAFFPNAAADVAILARSVARRIDDDRDQLGVVIGLAVEQQQTRLSGDGDANLVGQLEPAGALEMFLGQKYRGVAEQLGLVGGERRLKMERLRSRIARHSGGVGLARSLARRRDLNRSNTIAEA